MIFLLIEEFKNGTVTMGITTTGIHAETFEEAAKILKDIMTSKYPNVELKESVKQLPRGPTKSISYFIPGQFPTYGELTDLPLHFLQPLQCLNEESSNKENKNEEKKS